MPDKYKGNDNSDSNDNENVGQQDSKQQERWQC